MAERLWELSIAEALGVAPGQARELVYSHSAGTGGWHEGKDMDPPAARQIRARGGDDGGFAARKLLAEHLDGTDLVLCATGEQQRYVRSLRPDAASRTFVLAEFGRLLPQVDRAALPPAQPTPQAVYDRGVALVAAVDALRDGAAPRDSDDLDDPWGLGEQTFTRVADEIEATLRPFARLLVGDESSSRRA